MSRIAFIGLGVMGFPMAGHLARAGHELTVFNRTASKASNWVAESGGRMALSASDAAADAEVAICCVGNDQDLAEVVLGNAGLLQQLQPHSLLIDHTTASASLARHIHQACIDRSIQFIDAPVSGGQQGAIHGQLTIMCGGDPSAYERALPIVKSYALQCQLMGPSGSGQLTKMVNQIAICGLLQSLAEALRFAEAAGLDRLQVIEVISKGAAQSWQMDNRHRTMIAGQYDHGFAVDWMRKDLAILLAEAKSLGVPLPIAALVDQFYQDVQNMGGGRWDTSALLARLEPFDRPVKSKN
jgi:3-hydroxyisobutyrate dehydrogenase-like beta-hydroxyacid dehydrogenase